MATADEMLSAFQNADTFFVGSMRLDKNTMSDIVYDGHTVKYYNRGLGAHCFLNFDNVDFFSYYDYGKEPDFSGSFLPKITIRRL